VLIAVLMVSTVRYPSGKKVDLQTSTRLSTFVLVVSVAGVLVLFKEFGLLACTLSYIFFGLIRHWRRARVARKQSMLGSV
jgi:CDP-diacylglycerol--serine O-phosphatidyltransferase